MMIKDGAGGSARYSTDRRARPTANDYTRGRSARGPNGHSSDGPAYVVMSAVNGVMIAMVLSALPVRQGGGRNKTAIEIRTVAMERRI